MYFASFRLLALLGFFYLFFFIQYWTRSDIHPLRRLIQRCNVYNAAVKTPTTNSRPYPKSIVKSIFFVKIMRENTYYKGLHTFLAYETEHQTKHKTIKQGLNWSWTAAMVVQRAWHESKAISNDYKTLGKIQTNLASRTQDKRLLYSEVLLSNWKWPVLKFVHELIQANGVAHLVRQLGPTECLFFFSLSKTLKMFRLE